MPYYPPPPPAIFVAAQKEEPSAPKVVLAPTQETYRLGDPITLTYQIPGTEAITLAKPLPGGGRRCGNEPEIYDFQVSLQVTPLRGTLPTTPIPWSGGINFNGGDVPRSITANDSFRIALPGDYRVTARLKVLRPAGTVREVVSNTVIVRVADSAEARAVNDNSIADDLAHRSGRAQNGESHRNSVVAGERDANLIVDVDSARRICPVKPIATSPISRRWRERPA